MDKFKPKDAEKFTKKAANDYAKDLWAMKANEIRSQGGTIGEAIHQANKATKRYRVG